MNHSVISKQQLSLAYQITRSKTEALCQALEIEDFVIQSIEDVSPPKWHLAHTSWFFETFLLKKNVQHYQLFHPTFHYLFNSYYQRIGHPYPRKKRGLLSRPTVKTILNYRKYVNECLLAWIDQWSEDDLTAFAPLLALGLHHEQQHQELLLMDIKHNFSINPDFPTYYQRQQPPTTSIQKNPHFAHMEGGIIELGHQGNAFCFDNELPRHAFILKPYFIATRLVTNGEYEEFIKAGGYQQPDWWLADGFDCIKKNKWHAPLYWQQYENKWHIFTLNGLQVLNPQEPVSHVSFYEADAFARWVGMRLCNEAEWEHYAVQNAYSDDSANFLETNRFHPCSAANNNQLLGDVWEWTTSSYGPYPGYKALHGALGEYNGKFMSNQFVLRGGCCVTPQSHIRISYRNFFQPEKRWQFSGIRLAKDVEHHE